MVIFIADTSRLPGFPLERLPDRIVCADFLKEALQIAVQGAHLVDGVHGVIGRADLAEARGAYELEEAQAGLAVGRAFKIRVLLRQDRMSGAPDGAVALDVSVDHPAEVGGIALELFEVAVRLVARKCRGQHERRVAKQIVSNANFVPAPHIRVHRKTEFFRCVKEGCRNAGIILKYPAMIRQSLFNIIA